MKSLTIAGLIVSLLGLIIAVLTYSFPQLPAQMFGKLTPPDRATLSQLFSRDLLGLDIAYAEAITGPPLQIDDSSGRRHYLVNGCEVEIVYSARTITAYGLHVTPTCTFSWIDVSQVYSFEFPPPHQIRFRDVFRLIAHVDRRPCIFDCGNGGSGPIYSIYSGGHEAANGRVITFVSHLNNGSILTPSEGASDLEIDASFRFEQRVRGETRSDDYCNHDLTSAAEATLGELLVDYVEIGWTPSNRFRIFGADICDDVRAENYPMPPTASAQVR